MLCGWGRSGSLLTVGPAFGWRPRMRLPALFVVCGLLVPGPASAATRYVWAGSLNPGPGYTYWTNAAHTIQDAVDVAVDGDEIVVTNGVYSTGGRIAGGSSTSNRVAINKAITVRSFNNAPTGTIIVGQGPTGPYAVRCAFVGVNATLMGFTLTNGFTRSDETDEDQSGGGAWCESSGLVSNCIIGGNSAVYWGGGIRGGTVRNCRISSNSSELGGGAYGSVLYGCFVTNNSASDSGGGTAWCTLYSSTVTVNSAVSGGGASESALDNCTISGNTVSYSGGGAVWSELRNCAISSNIAAVYGAGTYDCDLYGCTVVGNPAGDSGGGAYMGMASNCLFTGNSAANTGGGASEGTLYSCTLVNNAATNSGGGAFQCTLYNSILWYNSADGGTNWVGDLSYCCTTPAPEGNGNIGGDPDFVDRTGGDYRLAASSPCVDAGTNQDWMAGALDLGGNPRIVNSVVDIGAHETTPYHYAATNGGHVSPFIRWQDAATNLQDAVDAALRGDVVFATNGVYEWGGRAVYLAMTNRVAIDRPITVRSVNGPAVTAIKGRGPQGNGAVRCAYVGTNALLEGFTLTNGFTRGGGDTPRERSGGGVWCDTGGAVSNCVIMGSSANYGGGGAYSGTLYNCTLQRNIAGSFGGGCYYSTLYNCTVSSNNAPNGGGAFTSTVSNCIIYYNSASAAAPNWTNTTISYSCTTPLPGGLGNITNAPMFVNTNAFNYRLQVGSPCVNTGTNLAWTAGATDLDGRPRVIGGRVDMGAYESTNGTTASGISWGWLVDHGLATDGTADHADPDEDEMDNGEEYGADTDPNSAASLLAITNIQVVAQGMRIDWQGGTSVTQYLERADSIMATGTQWRALTTNAPMTTVTNGFVDTSAISTSRFYRVKTVR